MRMCDKIKFMRQAKSLSQEEMAEKISLSLSGNANIERGETGVASLRMKQIAEALDADFMELVGFGERNVLFLTGGEHHTNNVGVMQNSKADLEKAQFMFEIKDKEIAMQQHEIGNLNKIISMVEAK
jgi:transcriptional regulator with XRE-family HTH domain